MTAIEGPASQSLMTVGMALKFEAADPFGSDVIPSPGWGGLGRKLRTQTANSQPLTNKMGSWDEAPSLRSRGSLSSLAGPSSLAWMIRNQDLQRFCAEHLRPPRQLRCQSSKPQLNCCHCLLPIEGCGIAGQNREAGFAAWFALCCNGAAAWTGPLADWSLSSPPCG
jgi:hypothetical protein